VLDRRQGRGSQPPGLLYEMAARKIGPAALVLKSVKSIMVKGGAALARDDVDSGSSRTITGNTKWSLSRDRTDGERPSSGSSDDFPCSMSRDAFRRPPEAISRAVGRRLFQTMPRQARATALPGCRGNETWKCYSRGIDQAA